MSSPRFRLEHDHAPEAIRARLQRGPRSSYLRDAVLGGIDGTVTTFAVVCGVVGASLSPAIVLILGFANLLADGFSMAASNYSATRSEIDEVERIRAWERHQIKAEPEGEREEIREIYRAKGFRGADLERVVETITSDEDQWVDVMLAEEYGAAGPDRSSLLAAVSTFAAFAVCGFAPLLPFLATSGKAAFLISIVLSGAVFFGIGSFKSLWSIVPWWRQGGETLVIGAVAAALAYAVGALLRGLVG